jgi:hypothetical protein
VVCPHDRIVKSARSCFEISRTDDTEGHGRKTDDAEDDVAGHVFRA